jgi:hypothetical protein
MLLFFRTTTFVGVCVEFVAAVAWLAELFPNPHQREKVLGYTQAFSSIGGLLVASANSLAGNLAAHLPAVMIPDFLTGLLGQVASDEAASKTWRYTLMSGLIPAIPLLLIRPFLPESPAWAKKKAEGTLRRPSLRALFAPDLRRTTIVTMIMFACSYGAAFGAIQQLPDIVPGLKGDVKVYKEKIFIGQQAKLPEAERKSIEDIRKMDEKYNSVLLPKYFEAAKRLQQEEPGKIFSDAEKFKAAGFSDSDQKLFPKLKVLTTQAELKIASDYTKVQEIGGLVGRFLLAMIAVYFISRRNLLRVFQLPGLFIMPLIFWFFLDVENTEFFRIPLDFLGIGSLPITVCSLGIFAAGLLTVAQFSFWGNYLPTAYPVHLRGSGESFAANIGGRLIGTSFAWVTSELAVTTLVPGDSAPAKFAAASAIVALFVYLVGSIACCFLPEPKGQMD